MMNQSYILDVCLYHIIIDHDHFRNLGNRCAPKRASQNNDCVRLNIVFCEATAWQNIHWYYYPDTYINIYT